MKIVKYSLAALVLLAAVAAAVLYSWTRTPYGPLDPGAAIVSKLAAWSKPEANPYSPEHRAKLNAQAASYAPREYADIRIEQHDVEIPAPWGAVRARVYVPPGAGPFPAVLNIHGGGFFMGNGYVLDGPVKALANLASMVVVSVDYRLAPEHPYPAGLNDSYRALEWMHENAQSLNIDPEKIGVMGGSAGGNIAAALTLIWRDKGGHPLAFQYLSFPGTDLSGQTRWQSFEEMGDEYSLRVSGVREMQDLYAPGDAAKLDPYASPLLAKSHSQLPPALIVVAQFDPLRDQGIAYAKALEADAVPVTLRVVPGVTHGMVGSPGKARATMSFAAETIGSILGGGK